jgi:hypothetical protein
MMCFRLNIRLVSWLHVLIVINFNKKHMHSLNHSLILHVYSVILYLCHLGTIFCDVFSLDICLIFFLHVIIHIYNQSNYVSTGINH